MDQLIFEGRWDDLLLNSTELTGKTVRVLLLEGEASPRAASAYDGIQPGIFPALRDLTDDAFRAAEWRGDEDPA